MKKATDCHEEVVTLRRALALIGNMVGAPTMQYADAKYQLEHLENRLSAISELVQEALRST
jgi:hypothetical protein